MADKQKYAPGSYPDLPPPPGTIGVTGWLRANLFSSVGNSICQSLPSSFYIG